MKVPRQVRHQRRRDGVVLVARGKEKTENEDSYADRERTH
jgi:hypothetical protein